MTEHKFEVVDDYTVKYDGDYFDLHKPSDIRSLVTVANYIVTENEQLKQSVNNLKETIFMITMAYQKKYGETIVDLVDEVHKKDITDIKELNR